jgi:tetratricopeptide (TPR) repeat protein
VQRVRGQLSEARGTVDTVLGLSEGLSDRELAPIHELRGDLLQAEGKWEEAQAAFEKAHTLDTERVGAEKKFAEATLRIGEAKAIASGSMLGLTGDGFGGPRRQHGTKPGIAVIASLFVPGFGQLVNGELVKAGICLGVFLLTLVALRLSPDSVVLFAKINALVAPNGPAAARALDPLSPLMIALLILLAANWVYSLFDAAAGASKAAESTSTNAPPAGDRSGWEV